jgi:hypothetical protein
MSSSLDDVSTSESFSDANASFSRLAYGSTRHPLITIPPFDHFITFPTALSGHLDVEAFTGQLRICLQLQRGTQRCSNSRSTSEHLRNIVPSASDRYHTGRSKQKSQDFIMCHRSGSNPQSRRQCRRRGSYSQMDHLRQDQWASTRSEVLRRR